MQSIYHSLLDSRSTIRLLTLHPAQASLEESDTPVLTCTLRTVSLLESPSYVALSYTWGNSTTSQIIHINGEPVPVGENLAAALSHIRKPDRLITLWVDAVCINQEDNLERSHQVSIMAVIYSKAEYVVAWLGVAADHSDKAMDLYSTIGTQSIEAGILDLRGNDLRNLANPGEDERLSRIKHSLDAYAQEADLVLFDESLTALSKREYWTRTWIVQELTVAQHVMLMCGSKTLPFRTFSGASNFCGYARTRRANNITPDQWKDPVQGPDLQASMARAPSAAPNIIVGIRRRYQEETGDRESFYGLLKRTCFAYPARDPLKATKSIDKIYGLLGLDPGTNQLGLYPDYDKTPNEAYMATTRALIADGQINILAWSQKHKNIQDLASWVPDFSSAIYPPCGENDLTGSTEAIYNASGQESVSIIPNENPNVIGLRGILIDTIDCVGAPWIPTLQEPYNYDGAKSYFDDIANFCKFEWERGPKLDQDTKKWVEGTWRIPCADQEGKYSGRDRASPTIHGAFLEVKQPNARYIRPSKARLNYMKVLQSLHDRRSFSSKEGYVGLAPAHSKSGDIICILFGADFPFIIREAVKGQYELVGEAFVYGIMDGEGLELGKEVEEIFLI
ncbi:uncharacterized protein PAC_15562 [Phialocephala subalpina]|uniref:Heterokaryon incompatibility domain-containing protein n=1 Tax=Phialocephala subalpina TaxID=576137 RepID=A0A1L7XKU8_9HELO|nr:uncharacterized protein PAC_15562 [Phialocephala subalpina]